MENKEISLDLTDALATYSVKELIAIFKFLDDNKFTHLYFDGYDAAIYALRNQ